MYDEHTHVLSIYWSTRDVIGWLVENSDDEHLQKVKQNAEQHAVKMEVASRSVLDESALFDDDDEIVISKESDRETSKQRLLSKSKPKPEFQGLRQVDGHKIQDIKELMTVPVSRNIIHESGARFLGHSLGYRNRRSHQESGRNQGKFFFSFRYCGHRVLTGSSRSIV